MIPQDEAGALVAPEHTFEVGILDPFFTDPFTEIRKSWRDRSELLLHFLLNIALAPLTVARAVARVRPGGFWSALVPLATFLAMFVLLHVVQIAADGVFVFAWVFFIGTVNFELRSVYKKTYHVKHRASNIARRPTSLHVCPCLPMSDWSSGLCVVCHWRCGVRNNQ